MKRFLRLISPLLFVIYPTLYLVSINISELVPEEIFQILVLLLLAGSTAYAGLALLIKNQDRAALHISLFSLFFFSFGHICNVFGPRIPDFPVPAWIPGSDPILILPVMLTLYVFIAVLIQKTDETLLKKFSSWTSAYICLMTLFTLGSLFLHTLQIKTLRMPEIAPGQASTPDHSVQERPDIYYLILDGYGASRTLLDVYGFNNNEMTSFLEATGFHQLSPGHSNYQSTTKSFASFLNLQFLDTLASEYGVPFNPSLPLFEMIQNNLLMRFLKRQGYSIVYFRSPFSIVDKLDRADVQIQCTRRHNLLLEVIRTSLLCLFKKPLFHGLQEDFKAGFLCTYKELKKVPSLAGPKIVFAHILCPHPPYLFDHKGPRQAKYLKLRNLPIDDRPLYIEQLRFLNTQIREVITAIQTKSEKSAVIIIHSDHGAPFPYSLFNGSKDDYYQHRLEIFNAIYFPDGDYSHLYDGMSLVNLWRAVLNKYFQAGFPYLDDHAYYTEDDKDWDQHRVEFPTSKAQSAG